MRHFRIQEQTGKPRSKKELGPLNVHQCRHGEIKLGVSGILWHVVIKLEIFWRMLQVGTVWHLQKIDLPPKFMLPTS